MISLHCKGRSTEEEIRILSRGDYFGEQSLIKEDRRSANIIAMSPGVECLTLDREAFKQLIGDLEELHRKDYGDNDRIFAIRQIENRQIRLVEQEREIERGKNAFKRRIIHERRFVLQRFVTWNMIRFPNYAEYSSE